MEEGLERFYPQLPADIDRYFEKNAGELVYAGCRSVPGEAAKTGFAAWEKALRHIVEAGIDRHSYIIAVGGGAFLDVAGFCRRHRPPRHPAVAACPPLPFPRRIPGVGVKNGINFMGQKNYLGTFAVAGPRLTTSCSFIPSPSPLKGPAWRKW